MHQVPLCEHGSDHCTQLTNPEHRRNYRHEGLPDFLIPCRFRDQCRDRSNEHLKKFEHPARFYQSGLTNSSTQRTSVQQACRYGSECRHQTDSNHCSRFTHPAASMSTPSKATASSLHSCVNNDHDEMSRAYQIGAVLAMEKLSRTDQAAIQNMAHDAIVVVPGTYDHIDRVFDSLRIKFITVQQANLSTYPFRSDQTVYINCATSFPVDAARRMRQLVESGLHLVTTDWALQNVLQVSFADFVRHNGKATGDEVVSIQVVDPNHPLVHGFLPASKHAEPQWWLETSSQPIEIVDKQKVRVLIRSRTLGEKYQSDAVLITFNCGKGNVIHMISHFYLQRSETRDARHQLSAKQYAIDVKASTATADLVANQGQNLNYAQIQSSTTSAQFIYNQISRRLNP